MINTGQPIPAGSGSDKTQQVVYTEVHTFSHKGERAKPGETLRAGEMIYI